MLNPTRILTTFLIIIFGSSANGQWSSDPTVNTPICTASGDQVAPSIIELDNNEYAIFWIDSRNGNQDIYAQKIDVFGNTLWNTNGIPICEATGDQWGISAQKNNNNEIVVMWTDNRRNIQLEADIYAQKISSSGTKLWTGENGVEICGASGFQGEVGFIVDESDNILVFWGDSRDSPGNMRPAYDLYTQKISGATGTRMFSQTNGKIFYNAGVRNSQIINSIIRDETNGAYLSWFDHDFDTKKLTGYVQRINTNGEAVWTHSPGKSLEGNASSTNQSQINLFKCPNNGVIIIYIQGPHENFNELILRPIRFDANGNYDNDWFPGGVLANNSEPALMFANINNGVTNVFWYDTTMTEFRAQSLNPSKDRLWGVDGTSILDTILYVQSIPSDDGSTILMGIDAISSPALSDIYSQKIDKNGQVLWEHRGVQVSIADGFQEVSWRSFNLINRKWLVSDNQGGAIFIWEDKRNFDIDIYAQRVTNLGLLGNITYPEFISFNGSLQYESKDNLTDYDSTDYQIWGMPGNGSKMIHEIFPGSHLRDWQVYWDTGDSINYLREYNQFDSDAFTPKSGKGYWVLYKGDLNINEVNIPSVNLNSDFDIAIPLHNGWNLISNPTDSDVAWANIQAYNNISSEIFHYKKGYIRSSILRSGLGYYFENTTGLDSLRLPLQSISTLNSSLNIDSKFVWKIDIDFYSGILVDHTASFGTFDAPLKASELEFSKPTRFPTGVSLNFADNNQNLKTSDFRNNNDSLKSWKIQTTQIPGKKSHLVFRNISKLPQSQNIYLLSENGFNITDLRQDSVYTYSSPNKTSIHYILVGQESEISEFVNNIEPSEILLEKNYPNPFNGNTSIKIQLPERIIIDLTIFNPLGQRIKTLYSGTMDKGRYSFNWDGRNKNGNFVASGFYFYILKTSKETLSRKLLYVK